MKPLHITTLLLVLCMTATAQPVDWARSIGGNLDSGDIHNNLRLSTVTSDKDGDVFVSGTHMGRFTVPELDVTLPHPRHVAGVFARFSSAGQPVWVRSIISTKDCRINAHVTSPDGQSVLTGFFDGTALLSGATDTLRLDVSGQGIFIARYDAQGNVQWAKKFATAWGEGVAVAMNSRGDVYVALCYWKMLEGDDGVMRSHPDWNYPDKYLVLVKYDADGRLQWFRDLDMNERPNTVRLRCDSNDDLLISGCFVGSIRLDDSVKLANVPYNEGSDAFIARMDDRGRVLWVKHLAGRNDQIIMDMQVDPFGNVVVTGLYRDECVVREHDGIVSQSDLHRKAGDSFFLIKVNRSGRIQWTRFHDEARWDTDFYARSLCIDHAGNLHVFGSYSNTVRILDHKNDSADLDAPQNGTVYPFYSIWDRDGQLLQLYSLAHTGRTSCHYVSSAVSTPAGRIVGAGEYMHGGFFGYDRDGDVVELKTRLEAHTGAIAQWFGVGTDAIPTVVEVVQPQAHPDRLDAEQPGMPDAQHLQVSIFPNPTSGKLTIRIGNLMMRQTMVDILDMSGQVVYSDIIEPSESSVERVIDLHAFPTGTYHIRCRCGGMTQTRSVILVQ